MHIFATYLKKLYDAMILVPRWILFIITGGIGSILINFLHRPSKKQSRSAVPGAPTTKPIAAKTISEPQDKPSALSTATSDPLATPRTLRKGKRKDDRHNQASQAWSSGFSTYCLTLRKTNTAILAHSAPYAY